MRSQTFESARFENLSPMLGGGGSGGGGQNTQTVQKSDPWEGQQTYLKDIFAQAQTQSAVPLEFYPGQTYADPSAATTSALQGQIDRAMAGSPLTSAAQGQLTSTLSGDYLDAGNPYLGAAFNSAANAVIPRMASTFEGSGRYGSGAAANATASALTDLAGNMAYQNYGDERMNQMRGMMFAPQMAQQDYFDIAKLAEAGAAQEDLAQQGINEAQARFNFEQNQPWQQLGLYSNLVQGYYGGQQETNQTLPRSPIGASMLGGAAAGGGLGYLLGGPQYGMYGAGIGGLLGMV